MSTTLTLRTALGAVIGLLVLGGSAAGASAAPTKIDSAGLSSVACPSLGQCTAVDNFGDEVTFDPASVVSPTPSTIDNAVGFSSVACPSVSQCTAVDGAGAAVTFDPTAPGNPTKLTLASTYPLAVACPSVSQCTAVTNTVNGDVGDEVTFNPNAAATPTVTQITSTYLRSVACPSTSQCTAVGDDGEGVTFDPNAPGQPTPTQIDPGDSVFTSGGSVVSVSCPSVSQCTAVDDDGQEVTFDPTSPGSPIPSAINDPSNGAPSAVDCPSVSQCTVVGNGGYEVTFNPASPASRVETTIDGTLLLESLACPSTGQCTAVDYGTLPDSDGQEVTFAPPATGSNPPLSPNPPPSPNPPTPQPAPVAHPPARITSPVIRGTAREGARVTCSHGTWRNDPVSYTYQWYRDGTPLVGVTRPTYRLDRLDEGATLRCVVTAINAAGRSSATSRGVTAPIPHVRRCPAATGVMTATRIGQIRLGMTRRRARYLYRRDAHRYGRYDDTFCLTPAGVSVGYASPKLLKGLPARGLPRVRGRVVWSSTSDPYYSLDGVRVGESTSRALRVLGTTARLHLGSDDWYLARRSHATAILKVRDGVVDELGIADNAFTTGRRLQTVLIRGLS